MGIYVNATILNLSASHNIKIREDMTKINPEILSKPGISLKLMYLFIMNKVTIIDKTGNICIKIL